MTEAAVLRGMGLFATVLVLGSPLRALDEPEGSGEIDRAIEARAGGPMAERTSDAEFLRRICLDLAGTIPASAEARAFLADADPRKRAKLVDRLLASPEYSRRMEQAVSVMFLERRGGKAIPDPQWSEYLRKAFAANEPWDRIVRTMLAADGREPRTRPAMKFLADGAQGDQHRMTNDVARLLLGKNLLCAQCHDHPVIKEYKQADYMGLYAYLNQSKLQNDPKSRQAILVEGVAKGKVEFASVFSPAKKHQTGPRLPGCEEVEVPTFEKGKEYETPPAKGGDPGVPRFRPRELLAQGLVTHPQFARNSVNRFWFLLMGRGLVHPLDLDHSGNPPSHPEILEALIHRFEESGFDVRGLLRTIVLSETYQRSSRRPEGAAPPPQSYRAALLKPLSAEQMAWSVMTATGNLEEVLKALVQGKSKFTTKDYLNGRCGAPVDLEEILRLFAEILGNAPGEPEVEFQPSMTHALFLMNERVVLGWLKSRPGNLADRLAKLATPEEVSEELYLSVLTRLPDAADKREVEAHLRKSKDRRVAALGELAWALLASAEFRLNH